MKISRITNLTEKPLQFDITTGTENFYVKVGEDYILIHNSPVIYYGRDEQGNFSMIPKNAWDYIKRGKTELDNGASTIMKSPQDIENFILNTGKVQPGKEADRAHYAKSLASLWPYFEQVSPEVGYIEGGLLFYPGKPAVLNPKTNEYDFTPNITSFHIPQNSKLGRRIQNAKMMVAATGYYEYMGSSNETRYPNSEGLSTPDVIVQGTTYIEDLPEIKTPKLDKVEEFITKYSDSIDSFIEPKPGLSKPGDILYKFYNQNLRIPGVYKKFNEWAKQNLTEPQQEKVLNHPGLSHMLMAVSLLSDIKLQIVRALSTGTYQDIRQTKPEGYVQAHPGTKFKNDLPGQFIKAIDQEVWSPRKEVAEDRSLRLFEDISRTGESNSAVVGWGRGMGHRGHMFLASSVITHSKEIGADPYFVVSRVVGKDDPVTPQEKLQIYKKVFPGHSNIFQTATDEMPDLTRVLHHLGEHGYNNVTVIVGEDQKAAFQYVVQTNNKPNKSGLIPYSFDSIRVISRQETSDPSREQEGPRATPMREVLLDPNKTHEEKFAVWRRDMSKEISDKEVLELMTKAEERLKQARVKKPRAKKINEATDYGGMKFYTDNDEYKIHKLTKPKQITPGQKKSLRSYTSGSMNMSDALHKQRKKSKQITDKLAKKISNIDDALKSNPLEGPVQVFTGVPESIQQTYKHYGADPSLPINLILPAFTSTSTRFNTAINFAAWRTMYMDELTLANKNKVPAKYLKGKKNMRNMFRIVLPKGFSAASIKDLSDFSHENEILMARDTMIQVSPNPTLVMHYDTPILVWDAKILKPEKKVNEEAKPPIPKLSAHRNEKIHRDNSMKIGGYSNEELRKSVRSYTSGSTDIADRLHRLRRNEPVDQNDHHENIIKNLDDILSTHRLGESVVVYHGSKEPITETYKNYNANTEMPINLILPAFTSTTTTFRKSFIFGKPQSTDTSWVVPRNRDKFQSKEIIARHVIMMRLPKGFNAASVKEYSNFENEDEILMARNTMIQIDPHPTFYVPEGEHTGIFIWHAKILTPRREE